MEMCALIFMVMVGAINAVSIRIVTPQKYKEIEKWYDLGGYYSDAHVDISIIYLIL